MDALRYVLWSIAPGFIDSYDWYSQDPQEQERLKLLRLREERDIGEPPDDDRRPMA